VFKPSCHLVGEHGDLYRCRDCGTVHQPSLPSGAELEDLYREMSDDRYLEEEAGRRRTARRLLDLLAGHMPAGRLLEIGCGHGLLLDEARRRGYDVSGLELSGEAARYAREALGLPVQETALEDLASNGERYDVLVLIDVLEHVSDPIGTLDRSCSLLAPGGALLIATPDPSSFVARAMRRRWWSYLPAHYCLIPRRTLRELLCARGLVLVEDVPYVASFTLRYWLAGLAERGGRASGQIARLAARLPRAMSLTASLRDEHVLLARRLELRTPARPRARTRGAGKRVDVVVPAHNAAGAVGRAAAAEHGAETFDRVLLVDDASSDGTADVALDSGWEVLAHPVRCGYGASLKSGCARAVRDGADVVVTIGGEHEWDSTLVERMAAPIVADSAEVVVGRPGLNTRRAGGLLSRAANGVLSRSCSRSEIGCWAFSADFLQSVAFLRNSDDSAFDAELLAQIAARGARVLEVPILEHVVRPSAWSRALVAFAECKALATLLRLRVDRGSGGSLALRPPAATLAPLSPAS
jgi:SAM-dependent methyltransferase